LPIKCFSKKFPTFSKGFFYRFKDKPISTSKQIFLRRENFGGKKL